MWRGKMDMEDAVVLHILYFRVTEFFFREKADGQSYGHHRETIFALLIKAIFYYHAGFFLWTGS